MTLGREITAAATRPARILIISSGLGTGGAEAMLVKLMERLDRSRFSVTILSLLDEGTHGRRLAELGIRVECLNLSGWRTVFAGVRKLRSLIHELQPEVIQGWMYHGNLAAWFAGYLAKDAAVQWNVRHSLHSLNVERLPLRILIRLSVPLSRRIAACIYPSAKAREQHLNLGFRSDNAVLIPNGFDLNRFKPLPNHERLSMRDSLGVAADGFLIAHVARYHPMKDHAGFLRAVARFASTKDHVSVAMAGTGVSKENTVLTSLINELGLASRVRFMGELQDVRPLLGAADCLCVSSAWGEAFPNVIGEAMAVGTPCVVTDVGDSAAIVGDCGFVVPPNDVDALAAALETLASMPSDAKRVLGFQARERVTTHYSIDKIAEEYQRCFIAALGAARKGALSHGWPTAPRDGGA